MSHVAPLPKADNSIWDTRYLAIMALDKLIFLLVSPFGLISGCLILRMEYIPSKVELVWKSNIREWQNDYCATVKTMESTLFNLTAAVRATNTMLDSHTSTLEVPDASQVDTLHNITCPSAFISKFVVDINCAGQRYKFTEAIEPIVAALRHPLSPCQTPDSYLLSRDYIILMSAHRFHLHHRVSRKLYFDLGASSYADGAGGASQKYFIEAYKKRGITFDRILLWEANTGISMPKLLSEVPAHLLKSYQYFNIPASSDPNSPSNPLNILQEIAKPCDFVIFKLDIDTPLVEYQFIQQILSSPSISHLIDEFFFEDHVQFPPMEKYWGPTVHKNRTLYDAYDLLHTLRAAGIRAHGWP